MTNKEILAELKQSYEYLYDIRENGCKDHCSGQITGHIIKSLDNAINEVIEVYYEFYKTLDKAELEIDSNKFDDIFKKENSDYNNLTVYIGNCVDVDYNYYDKETKSYNVLTCEDLGYYWYQDKENL